MKNRERFEEKGLSIRHLYLLAWAIILSVSLTKTILIYAREMVFITEHAIRPAADFIVLWTARLSESPYDFSAVTEAQKWYTGPRGPRPFAYPPSILPWLTPFALLPMVPAYLIWTIGSACLFFAVCNRIVPASRIAISLAAPASAAVFLAGQVTFLVGSMTIGAISILRSRPMTAGALFGIAATIKPQTLLLLPVALIAGRHWRALGSAIGTGLAIGMLCVAIQGPALWIEWLRVLPLFDTLVRDIGINGITPTAVLSEGSFAGWRSIIINSAAILGLVTVWIIFRRCEDVASRSLALVCGTLLVLPYAMSYELAVAAPFAAAMLFNRHAHPLAWLAGFMVLTTTGMALALAVMCMTLLWFHLGGTPIREIAKA